MVFFMDEKIKIYALDFKGRGIARLKGKVIFVKHALIDEIVQVHVIKEKSKYMIGTVTTYLETSEKRVIPVCPFFGICGGCDIMHIAYVEQLKFKEEKVKHALGTFVDESLMQNIVYGNPLYYRNKVTFKVDQKLGFYEKESYKVVSIASCFLISKKMNLLLKKIQEHIPLSFLEEVMIREGKYTKEILLYIKGKKLDFSLSFLKEDVTTCLFDDGQLHILWGDGFIHEKLEKYTYKISPFSFFQVNTDGAILLYNLVKSFIEEKENVLDLYCGTGSIGIFISDKLKFLHGVEISRSAIEDAIVNQKRNHLQNAQFSCLDTSLFEEKLDRFSTVIVDPPRSGLDKHTRDLLLKEKVPKIIYVSCDLMTLKRDLEILLKQYKIKCIIPVDMFPNTYHVECVCVLCLR